MNEKPHEGIGPHDMPQEVVNSVNVRRFLG
jgi:hypothetical protein